MDSEKHKLTPDDDSNNQLRALMAALTAVTSGTRINIQTEKDRLREFLTQQRSGPYYSLVSVLFAVILSLVGVWVGSILKDGFDWRASGLQMPTAKIPAAVAKVDPTTTAMQLALALMLFFYIIYMWLYFSRIFIYLPETQVGEALTFILGFVLLTSVCAMPFAWMYWTFFLSACTSVVVAKCLYALSYLKRTGKLNAGSVPSSGDAKPNEEGQGDRKRHPFEVHLPGWIGSAILYTVSLFLLGCCSYVMKEYRVFVSGISLSIASCWAFYLVFFGFQKLEEDIRAGMKKYIEEGNFPKEFLEVL